MPCINFLGFPINLIKKLLLRGVQNRAPRTFQHGSKRRCFCHKPHEAKVSFHCAFYDLLENNLVLTQLLTLAICLNENRSQELLTKEIVESESRPLRTDLTGLFWTKLCEKLSLERSFGHAEEEV